MSKCPDSSHIFTLSIFLHQQESRPGSAEPSAQRLLMGGGFCTAALWDCITVAPCPHGEKASHKNLQLLSFSPLSLPQPASPYLSLHLCQCVIQLCRSERPDCCYFCESQEKKREQRETGARLCLFVSV